MVTSSDIDFWIKNNLNVHFSGKHGVGKTAVITEAWNRHKLNYVYLSGSTLDPWVDLIGIPKERENGDGPAYLDLIRPKCWANDDVEALFIDEYNRAPKAVRNAVMELIQFKSINGHKFHKLRFVWVACNPDDDTNVEYDVEPLDPAQKDRFHVWVEIPYKPDVNYFTNKFGSKIASVAIGWWNRLSVPVKELVSPRRLDYALDGFKIGGNLKHFLPEGANIAELEQKLNSTPIKDTINQMFQNKDDDVARTWLNDENNYNAGISFIKSKQAMFEYFLPLMPEEKISNLIATNNDAKIYAVQEAKNDNPFFSSLIDNIINAGTNQKLIDSIKQQQQILDVSQVDICDFEINLNPKFYDSFVDNVNYTGDLNWLNKQNATNTTERVKIYNHIRQKIPDGVTKSQLSVTLQQLEKVVLRSDNKTLKQFVDLIPILNYLIYRGKYMFGITPETLFKSYPALFKYGMNCLDFYLQPIKIK